MPSFTVRRRVDAYVDYFTQIRASGPKQAAELAARDEGALDWTCEGSCEFDAKVFVALDANGFEVEDSEIRQD
jgi:hypothetical protein